MTRWARTGRLSTTQISECPSQPSSHGCSPAQRRDGHRQPRRRRHRRPRPRPLPRLIHPPPRPPPDPLLHIPPPTQPNPFPYTTLFRSLFLQDALLDAVDAALQRIVEQSRQLMRSEEHTSELQSPVHLVCRLLLEKKNDALGANRTLEHHADQRMSVAALQPWVLACPAARRPPPAPPPTTPSTSTPTPPPTHPSPAPPAP